MFADSDALAAGASPFTTAVFVLVMVLAATLDVKSRRIPNALTVGGALVALILRAPLGWDALATGLLGAGLGLLLTVPLFLVKALGGGDVKLMAAVGAFMGPVHLAGASLIIALVGGVIAISDTVHRGALRTTLVNVGYMVVRLFARGGRRYMAPMLGEPTAMAIPYGVAIAVGAVIWWFSGGSWLWAAD